MERGLGRRALMLVVLAAVVALGAFLVVRPASAADVPLAADTGAVSAAPGDTVQIAVSGALAQVSITGTADGVSASFPANGGQSINCGDDASCDTDDSEPETAGNQNVPDQVRVDLKIAADSGEGYILVRVEGIGAGTNTAAVTKVINVSKATLVGSLKISASPTTIAAADGTSTLLVEVQNAAGTPAGLNDQEVSLITSLGSLECVSDTETQACSVTTADYDHDNDTNTDVAPGGITATLNGKGVEGVATVTAILGNLRQTVEVTFYGTAKNLTAEPLQNSVEIGGDVYVVLTVTDDAGNPVSGQVIEPLTSPAVEVAGPSDDAVLVVTEKNTPAADSANDAVGVGYSKDLIRTAAQGGNIPACGDDNVGFQASPSTEAFATDGTNDKGQCVVHVMAPEDDASTANTDEAATRGMHTLNFEISATVKASATIEVAGKPASITTDALATVDPASVTEITVWVFDDDDVLVGITAVKVRKVGGDGLIEDQGEDGSEMTADGQSKFTFIAPSSVGTSEILITAGDVSHRVMIAIGEPEDTGPSIYSLVSGAGSTYVSWQGGDASSSEFENVAGLVVVWKWMGNAWVRYVSDPSVPASLKTDFALSNGDVLFVVSEGPVDITLG